MPQITDDNAGGNKPLSQDRSKYFHPTPVFVKWMQARFEGKLIYDVGSGVGHVSKALAKAGMLVTAVDLEPRADSEFNVIKADSSKYQFEKSAVVMLCRPSHDNRFVLKTVLCALNSGARTVIYVGLQRNVRHDLGEYYREFKKHRIKGVGHADERVWELKVGRLQASANLRRGTIPPLSPGFSQ